MSADPCVVTAPARAPPASGAQPTMPERRSITTRTARIWIDDHDIIHFDGLPGVETTKADVEEIMASTWEICGHRRLPALADVRRVKAVDRTARAHRSSPERVPLAVALLVGSPLSRVIGNFFIGLNKTLIPSRLFTSEPEALAWLRGFRE
jgi:hypothetical protein